MITGVESCRRDRWARTDASRFPNRSISYLNNHHYNPTTGVFVSVDPLVTATMQPYTYDGANPSRTVIRLGLSLGRSIARRTAETPGPIRITAGAAAMAAWE